MRRLVVLSLSPVVTSSSCLSLSSGHRLELHRESYFSKSLFDLVRGTMYGVRVENYKRLRGYFSKSFF